MEGREQYNMREEGPEQTEGQPYTGLRCRSSSKNVCAGGKEGRKDE